MIRIEDITLEDIVSFLLRTKCRWKNACKVADFTLTVQIQGATMADLAGTVGQTVNAVITNIVDSGGNPVTPKNPPVWSTSNSAVLALTPAADSMSATGTLLAPGTVTIMATVDGILRTQNIVVSSGGVADFTLTVTLGAAQAHPKK